VRRSYGHDQTLDEVLHWCEITGSIMVGRGRRKPPEDHLLAIRRQRIERPHELVGEFLVFI